jgi:hypothetical protein
MNRALLAKWIIRYKDPNVADFWKDILKIKYSNRTNRNKYSVFWKDVNQDLDIIEYGLNKIVNNGCSTSFWLDRWCRDTSLT